MWEKINNSSLLFSKTFIENKKNLSIYSNRVFFHRIYFYYVNKGYNRIIITSIVNLLVTNFLVFFIIFLFNCIDYNGLFTLDTKTNLGAFIEINKLFEINTFFSIILILFLFLDALKIISIIDDVYIFSNIKKFYKNNLKIRDAELKYMEWNEVIEIYKDSVNNEINPYYVDSIISSKDNYFIALLDNKIIRPYHLNSLFEWNLIYCIIYSFIDNNEKVSDKLFTNPTSIDKSMKNRLKAISIISLILMPVIIVFITFYNLFNYGEQFYNTPNLFISRNFTRVALLNYRNYNELTHIFDERMEKLNKLTKKYSDTYKNNILEAILKLTIFVISSIFITLLIFTLANDRILTNLTLIGGRNVLWFIGVTGSFIAILRSIINSKNKENPIEIMGNISDHVIIDKKFIQNANMMIIRNNYLKHYSLKILQILYDICWTLFMPIQLWSISYDTKYITSFIKKISVNDNKIGIICKFSDFENNEDVLFGSLLSEIEKNNLNNKIEFSEEQFIKKYPHCLINNPRESTQINII
jgi:autophagy-related protein 9